MPAADDAAPFVHDFAAKLRQPGLREAVLRYLRWRREVRAARARREEPPAWPEGLGPLSINLDLTTACNYACDHCIDWDSLNSPVRHQDEALRASLRAMAERGLRSVILIGGGEPTLHPGFAAMVRFLKEELALQVAVVSNGSRNDRLTEVAPLLAAGDWVRLSLDAGRDETFQAMHRPRARHLTLEGICASAARIKERNPAVTLGFSFVITWGGARRGEVRLVENLEEMAEAAALARTNGFDYISFKPCLSRAPDGAEVLEAGALEAHERALARIRQGLAAARCEEGGGFQVLASINLRVLLDGGWRRFTRQPRECHMQALRQVVSPLGLYNCPAHRGVEKARIGGAAGWAEAERGQPPPAAAGTAAILDAFDASHECQEVTCLYNPVNHLLEELVRGAGDPAAAFPLLEELDDAFL